jgi:glycosyltransferase involved in cell wall biosynthesis
MKTTTLDPNTSTDHSGDGANAMPYRPVIMIPVYNDWESVEQLMKLMDGQFQAAGRDVEVLLVDDGSSLPVPPRMGDDLKHIARVRLLRLLRNIGHQRAIAIGLAWLQHDGCRAPIVIMDGDGEDKPEDVLRLLDKLTETNFKSIVFAERTRRSESLVFIFFYRLYCLISFLLTGLWPRMGNFSVVPPGLLKRITATAEMWNHYAAAIIRSRIPFVLLPTFRGRRLAGKSKMNFVNLVTHGLSAMSVFAETIGVRLLCSVAFVALLLVILVLSLVFMMSAITEIMALWLTLVSSLILLTLANFGLLIITFIFFILSGRQISMFLPRRDYILFVERCDTIMSGETGGVQS